MYYQIQLSPSDEEIRARSYMIWEREGRPEGKSEEHWLRAMAELEGERIASMNFRERPTPSEEDIRARSHLIWEREGRPEGKSEMHWLRAKAELEAEFHAECAAYVEGKSTTFVIPLLQVSSPPTLTESVRPGLTAESAK